jgi:flagellar basal body-associated protein FliL
VAEGDEEVEASEEGEETEKKSKKKLIIMIVVFGLITYKVLTMTVLKPPPPTPEQLKAAHEKAEHILKTSCALANELDPPPPLEEEGEHAEGEGKAEGEGEGEHAAEGEAAATTTTTFLIEVPVIGPVLEIDSKTLNLADGHFLKIGLALQLKTGALVEEIEEVDNFKAVAAQAVLNKFAGEPMADILPKEKREKIRHEIGYDVCMESEANVSTVYFTEFVAQ